MTTHEARLEALEAKAAIADVLRTLMLTVDDKDWAGARACLADEVFVDYTSLRHSVPAGRHTADAVIAEWRERMTPIPAVHHHVSNIVVTLDGNTATSRASVIATHRRTARADGSFELWHLGALYRHAYARENGRWRITSLVIAKLWDRTDVRAA